MSSRIAWIAAVCLLATAACGASLPDFDYAKEPDPRKREYVIGVSDELSINVWKNPELTTNATVRPDGTITMPLIGDLRAVGKTPTALKLEITEKLGQFIKDESAVVSIMVTNVNSYRFTVSGEVTNPGVFTSKNYVTVAEAIALAGGFSRFASRDKIVVMRQGKKGLYKIPIVWSLMGDHPEMNVYLLADDMIIVP